MVSLKLLDNYRVWLRYDDSVEGEVDFSDQVGKGVFAAWSDYPFFRQAHIGDDGRRLQWPGEIDLCADALYLEITGLQPEDLFPNLKLLKQFFNIDPLV